MSDITTHLLLPYILASQAQKHVTHNEALRLLDAMVQLSVLDRTRTAPPASPTDGDRHIVASGATGLWVGWDLNVAFWVDGVWMRLVPRPAFSFPGLWFQAGSTQIHLILESPESGPGGAFVPEDCSISRTRHIAFEVASAAEAVTILQQHQVEIVAGPKARPDGPTQLYVFDPDQNLVELFSYGL